MSDRICMNCAHYEATERECRRYPPVPLTRSYASGDIASSFIFPYTSGFAWCGEFQHCAVPLTTQTKTTDDLAKYAATPYAATLPAAADDLVGIEHRAREITRWEFLAKDYLQRAERAERELSLHHHEEWTKALAKVEAERDRANADAARYRWLRDGDGPQSSRWSRWRIEHWASPGPTWADIRGADLDAAIDAHLKEKP